MNSYDETMSIIEDDRYSEVFLDIEAGKTKKPNIVDNHQQEESKETEVEDEIIGGSELGSGSMSIGDVYKQDQTNDHFATKLASELANIKTQQEKSSWKRNLDGVAEVRQYYSNSPLTMSLCSSNCNSDYEESIEFEEGFGSKKKPFRKITYQEVEDSLNKHYSKDLQISSEIDILLTYLKGQKHIFKQASRITEQKYNFMMVPAIFMTGSMTVLAPFMISIGWSGYVFSVLNAILTIIITVNNFMKFQARSAIFLYISNQYDKLGISVEMTRNHYLFIEDGQEKSKLMIEKMNDTEKKIMTIQNNYNDIIIPYEVQLMNPVISNINIFSFIKKIEQHKKNLIMDYKDIKNNIRYVMFKWDKELDNMSTSPEKPGMNEKRSEEIEKMQKLLNKKKLVKTLLIKNNNSNVYGYIDNLFIREIQYSEKYYTYRSAGMYLIIKPTPLVFFKYGNEVVDDYLNFIFMKSSDPELIIPAKQN
jgi:hypothetical protein